MLFALILGLNVFYASAEDIPPKIEQPKEQTAQTLLEESNTILLNIQQLIQKSSELKEVAAEIPDFDQLLFTTLLISIENDIYSEFDNLINIQQKLDKTTPEAQYIHIQLQGLLSSQEGILRKEINKLKELIPKLRKQASSDSSTLLSIERARQIIFDLMVEWQKNIARQQTLNMDVTASVEDLRKVVQFVAITQTGRIRFNIDTIAELNVALDEVGPD